MKYFSWNKDKNDFLKIDRGVSFEMVVDAIEGGRILDRFNHPNQKRYPNQKVYIIKIDNYAYFVPYVEDEVKIFLKTIYPSRVATKKYIQKHE